MSWSDGYPDADLDRLLPGDNPHHADDARGHGQLVGIFLRVEPRQCRCALQSVVLGDRPCRHGFAGVPTFEFCATGLGRGINVHHHQDVIYCGNGRAAAVAATDYAVDDAGDDRRVYLPIPGWSGDLHIAIKHSRRSNPILRRRQAADRAVWQAVSRHSRNAG